MRPRRFKLQVTHLVPNADYRLEVHRTGYHANDAYSAYIEMGSPKDLSATQLAHLNELTRDLPEIRQVMQSGPAGTVEFSCADEQQRYCPCQAGAQRGN